MKVDDNKKELTKEQYKLIDKGLPADFLDNCVWCNGSGDDGGGYGACPDCQNTGMKYGQQAWDYIEEEADKAFNVHQTMIKTLCNEYGFGREAFIPDYVSKFFMTYFGHFFENEKYLSDSSVVKTEMLEEMPPGGLFPDVAIGYITKSADIGIFLNKKKELDFLKEESPGEHSLFKHLDGCFRASELKQLRKEIPEVNNATFETYEHFKAGKMVRFEIPYSALVQLPETIKYEQNNF